MTQVRIEDITYTADEIACTPPPPTLVQQPWTTNSSAIQNIYYYGGLNHWDTFEAEVEAFHAQHRQDYINRRHIAVMPRNDIFWRYMYEQILVGKEETLSGRFFQNVMLPAQCAVRALMDSNRPLCGDSKTVTKVNRREPDIVLMDSAQALNQNHTARSNDAPIPLAVGELKVHWVDEHQFAPHVMAWVNGTQTRDRYMDRLLGQIGSYMVDFKLRFGFLSTYEQTVFLKQENNRILVSSTIFRHRSRNNIDDEGLITLRMAMMWLMWQVTLSGDQTHLPNGSISLDRDFKFPEQPGSTHGLDDDDGDGDDPPPSKRGGKRSGQKRGGASAGASATQTGRQRNVFSDLKQLSIHGQAKQDSMPLRSDQRRTVDDSLVNKDGIMKLRWNGLKGVWYRPDHTNQTFHDWALLVSVGEDGEDCGRVVRWHDQWILCAPKL